MYSTKDFVRKSLVLDLKIVRMLIKEVFFLMSFDEFVLNYSYVDNNSIFEINK